MIVLKTKKSYKLFLNTSIKNGDISSCSSSCIFSINLYSVCSFGSSFILLISSFRSDRYTSLIKIVSFLIPFIVDCCFEMFVV